MPGKIRDANRPALLAQLRSDGFGPVDLGIGGDDQDILADRLRTGGWRCDAIIGTGGVSVGDHDVLKVARPRVAAIAETDLPRLPGPKLCLVRVTARTGTDGVLRVRPSGGQESHMLMAMAQANALALLPDGDGVRAGGRVEVLLDTDGL